MKYSKPALTREQQADLLISRGMMGDRDHIINQLSAVNYYRLSGYWHTFRLPSSHPTRHSTKSAEWQMQKRRVLSEGIPPRFNLRLVRY